MRGRRAIERAKDFKGSISRLIKELKPFKEYKLDVVFDDGKHVVYDVGEDIGQIKPFEELLHDPMLFERAVLDQSRTCVIWNDMIDLPSDTIYEYGESK